MPKSLSNWMVEQGAEHLWVAYTDYNGRLAGRNVPRARIAGVAEHGTNFAKANFNFTIRDVQVAQPHFGADTGDVLAIPDSDTVMMLQHQEQTALAFANLHDEDGGLWEGCPRTALAHANGALAAAGLSARVAFEPEFYLFQSDDLTPSSRAGMYTIDGLDDAMEFVQRLTLALSDTDVELEQIGKEYGKGQFEANLAPTTPMQATDNLLALRLTVRGIARQMGLIASFMPKPAASMAGCGLHVHLSLQDESAAGHRGVGGTDESGLSRQARAFMAGWLAHAEALTALGSPTPNSYKRLQPASWAPAHICWGVGNRAALVRVPGPGRRSRLEYRSGDNTSNPYLFLAGLIWAGLDGVERDLDPGEPVTADVGHLGQADLSQRGVRLLPRDAATAFDALESDEVLARGLGSVIHREFLRVKREELADYNLQVTKWERESYLEQP